MFEADQIRKLIGSAHRQFKAMILLGVNCGFGNADVAMLPFGALDLDGGWLDFPRPKDWHRATLQTVATNRQSDSGHDCQATDAKGRCRQRTRFHYEARPMLGEGNAR